jgi:hypothetical protein
MRPPEARAGNRTIPRGLALRYTPRADTPANATAGCRSDPWPIVVNLKFRLRGEGGVNSSARATSRKFTTSIRRKELTATENFDRQQ